MYIHLKYTESCNPLETGGCDDKFHEDYPSTTINNEETFQQDLRVILKRSIQNY